MNQIEWDTEMNQSHIKTEIMFRNRMNTSVIDEKERTPESQNSAISPKAVVRMSHP